MHLILESAIKTPEGIHEITVFMVRGCSQKKYTYRLASDFKTRSVLTMIRKGREAHGRALAFLNKHKIVPEQLKKARETVILTMNIYGEHSMFYRDAMEEYERIKKLEGFS